MFGRIKAYLLPTALILFILEILTLPLVIRSTYADRAESPRRVLTFTGSELIWDADAAVDEQGAAELYLFDTVYQNVDTNGSDNIFAPGTKSKGIVRIKNDSSDTIRFTATVYSIKISDEMPVNVSMTSKGVEDSSEYLLPYGVDERSVIRSVTGTVGGGKIKDFSIEWYWLYEDGKADTASGDIAAENDADDVTIGVYITVEDDSAAQTDGGYENVITPSPHTGYDSSLGGYLVLLCLSGALVAALSIQRFAEKKAKKNEG